MNLHSEKIFILITLIYLYLFVLNKKNAHFIIQKYNYFVFSLLCLNFYDVCDLQSFMCRCMWSKLNTKSHTYVQHLLAVSIHSFNINKRTRRLKVTQFLGHISWKTAHTIQNTAVL